MDSRVNGKSCRSHEECVSVRRRFCCQFRRDYLGSPRAIVDYDALLIEGLTQLRCDGSCRYIRAAARSKPDEKTNRLAGIIRLRKSAASSTSQKNAKHRNNHADDFQKHLDCFLSSCLIIVDYPAHRPWLTWLWS